MDVTASPSRILLVITKGNWGGAQRYVYDLAVAALEAGHEVTVACGTTGELITRLEEAHVPVVMVEGLARDIKASSDVRAFRGLVKLMRALRPDVVHSNSSKAGALAALAARVTGVRRSIFTCHGWAFNENRPVWQKIIIGFAHYLTVLLSDVTICVSAALKRDAKWMPLVQKRFVVIHNGVSPVNILAKDVARAALAPGMPADDRNRGLWIGTIAELHPTKQLSVAIEAFARIAHQFPAVHYFIMGDGQDRAHLESLIWSKQLNERIHLCGHVKDAPQYLSAFDTFVLPSRSEALGMVILEAGMATLPVIASNVGGIPEIISNNESGLLVRSGDVQQLTDALTHFLSNTELRHQFGTALHSRVIQNFSLDRMVRDTLTLYS